MLKSYKWMGRVGMGWDGYGNLCKAPLLRALLCGANTGLCDHVFCPISGKSSYSHICAGPPAI